MLNLAVQPQKGKALLFFPAFADGTSDPRCACACACLLRLRWLHAPRGQPCSGRACARLPAGGAGGERARRCCPGHDEQSALKPCPGPALTLPSPCPRGRSLHTAEDAAPGNTKWVTQQWVARGLAGAAADPIQAALAGGLPLGGSSSSSSAAPAVQPVRRAAAGDEGPSAAEALLAGKRSKGKKGNKKKGGGGGKGFGS